MTKRQTNQQAFEEMLQNHADAVNVAVSTLLSSLRADCRSQVKIHGNIPNGIRQEVFAALEKAKVRKFTYFPNLEEGPMLLVHKNPFAVERILNHIEQQMPVQIEGDFPTVVLNIEVEDKLQRKVRQALRKHWKRVYFQAVVLDGYEGPQQQVVLSQPRRKF